jgi:hypothetical protein
MRINKSHIEKLVNHKLAVQKVLVIFQERREFLHRKDIEERE